MHHYKVFVLIFISAHAVSIINYYQAQKQLLSRRPPSDMAIVLQTTNAPEKSYADATAVFSLVKTLMNAQTNSNVNLALALTLHAVYAPFYPHVPVQKHA